MGCIGSPAATSWDEQKFQSLSPHQFSHPGCQEGGQLMLLLTVIPVRVQAPGMEKISLGYPKSCIWICCRKICLKKKRKRKPEKKRNKRLLGNSILENHYDPTNKHISLYSLIFWIIIGCISCAQACACYVEKKKNNKKDSIESGSGKLKVQCEE